MRMTLPVFQPILFAVLTKIFWKTTALNSVLYAQMRGEPYWAPRGLREPAAQTPRHWTIPGPTNGQWQIGAVEGVGPVRHS
jgi:hypothetical protein